MHNKESRKFWVIAKEVYKKNVQSIGFILTLIAPIFMAVVPFAIGYFSQTAGEDIPARFAVISEDETARSLFESEEFPWEFAEDIQSESEARSAILDEELDAYMVIEVGEEVQAEITQVEDEMEGSLPVVEELLSSYQTSLRGAEANLEPEAIAQMMEPANLSAESIRVEDGTIVEGRAMEQLFQSLFVTLVGFGLFMLLMMYANSIVQEIASEKGTRIMEIILSTTSSTVHFGGKLVGILMVFATQFVVYIALFMFGLPYIEELEMMDGLFDGLSLTETIQPTYWYVFLFFVLGLLIYIIFSAFLGSLANKAEDSAKMMAPIQTVAAVGLYGSIFMMSGAENAMVNVLSYIPLFTPFIMPMRMVHGQVGTVEVAAGIIGSLIFTVVLLVVSLYFYRTNVLVYSDSNILTSLKRSWALMRSDRVSKKMVQKEKRTIV